MIIIYLEGDLIPYKAPQVFQRSTVNPRWFEKKQIQHEIKSQYNDILLSCPVCVEYVFGFCIPKNFSKKKQKEAIEGLLLPAVRPDNSNLIKFYDDCLQDTVISDDKLITDHIIKKRYNTKSCVYIKISKINDEML